MDWQRDDVGFWADGKYRYVIRLISNKMWHVYADPGNGAQKQVVGNFSCLRDAKKACEDYE